MSKSFWKQPGAKHYQLVHRSQRDPLVNDPSASQRVLREVDASQPIKGGSNSRPSTSSTHEPTPEEEVGDAAAYGIYYDDTEYNYLQHLKTVGDGMDSYLVEAPTSSSVKVKGKGKGKARLDEGLELRLPEDSLPSHPLDEVTYTELTSIQAPTVGLRPDLDPKIKEVLEALDDDAYAVDDDEVGEGGEVGTDDEEDDFWKEVVGDGGEVYEEEWGDEFEEDHQTELSKGVSGIDLAGGEDEGEWGQIAKFKAATRAMHQSDDGSDEEVDSEGGDTIAELRAASARRPKRGVPGSKGSQTGGSQFSMTSSAMFRNEGLRTLDDRFDEIEKLYDEDSEDSWGSDDDDPNSTSQGPEMHAPLRSDVLSIMDEFLSRYEVLGGKMRPVLEADPSSSLDPSDPAAKLERVRRELGRMDLGEEVEGEDPEVTRRRRDKERILEIVGRQEEEERAKGTRKRGLVRMDWEQKKDRWDCETVLSTYSNVSNHPRLVRLRDPAGPKPAKIRIDPKTGFPVVEGEEPVIRSTGGRRGREREEDVEMEGASDDEDEEEGEYRETIIRSRSETPAERKARKAAVKEERASRRVEKKSTKEAFGNETRRQKRIATKKVAGGAAADVRVGEGVRRLA